MIPSQCQRVKRNCEKGDENEMKVKKESEKAGLNSTFKKLKSRHLVPSLHGKQIGKKWKQQILFSWAPKPLQTVTVATKFKDT